MAQWINNFQYRGASQIEERRGTRWSYNIIRTTVRKLWRRKGFEDFAWWWWWWWWWWWTKVWIIGKYILAIGYTTHHPFTVPFAFAVFFVALSISCLCLTGSSNEGEYCMVRAAQFLGELYNIHIIVYFYGGGELFIYMLCKILMIISSDLYYL